MVNPLSKYSIIKSIGTGKGSKVYLVKEKSTNKLFVMKIISLVNLTPANRLACLNEVKVLSKLSHPHITHYKESFITNTQLHIVMEYCSGGDLYTYIRKRAKRKDFLSEIEILTWLTHALTALQYLHKQHILHRDIKSMNLLISGEGILKMGDFGVSKVLENSMALAQSVVGSPYYLSPELCQGSSYAWPSDIWSLGCVLYEMAYFKTPLSSSKSLLQLIDNIKRQKIKSLPKRYSSALNQLTQDMLSKQPDVRPSASDLLSYSIIQEHIELMLKFPGPHHIPTDFEEPYSKDFSQKTEAKYTIKNINMIKGSILKNDRGMVTIHKVQTHSRRSSRILARELQAQKNNLKVKK